MQINQRDVFDCVGHVVVSLRGAALSRDKQAKFILQIYLLYTQQYHIVILQNPESKINLSYLGELSALGIPVELRVHASADNADLSLPDHKAKIDVLLIEHATDFLESEALVGSVRPIYFWQPNSEKLYVDQLQELRAELPTGMSPQLRHLICRAGAPVLDLEHIIIDEGLAGEAINPLVVLESGKGLISSNCSGIGRGFSDLVHMATVKELPFNLNACVGGSAPICELMSTARSHGKIKCVEAVIESSWKIGAGDIQTLFNHRREGLRGRFDLMSFIAFGTTISTGEVERVHPDDRNGADCSSESEARREVLRLELTAFGPSAIIEMTEAANHEELRTLNPGQTGIFVTLENGTRWGAYGTDLTEAGRQMSLLAQLVDRSLADILAE